MSTVSSTPSPTNKMTSPPPGLLPRLQDFEALWVLASQIGDGGQGEVYETYPTVQNKRHYRRDAVNECLYVTKRIDVGEKKGALQRIVSTYSYVQRKALLNIYGIFHDQRGRQVLIVMQRLSHELDAKYFIESPPGLHPQFARPGYIYLNSPNSIKLFVLQIAQQLNEIHSRNRIHFDLKPQNIMFNAAESKWVIIDYDLMKKARLKKSNQEGMEQKCAKIGHYRGTQSWTSPEMSTRSSPSKPSIITKKSDIFAFGLLILYVIDGGYQPYLLEDADIKNVHCKELISSSKWRRDKVYFDKLLRHGNGDKYLQNYLFEMMQDGILSNGLYDLLKNMVLFDVNKRFCCRQILSHSWFYTNY